MAKTPFEAEQLDPKTVAVRVETALDVRNADAFRALCEEHLRAGALRFILDFSAAKSLDSNGLGRLLWLYREVVPNGGTVVFGGASEPVAFVVRLTRIDRVFRQYPSVEAAYAALESQE